MGWYHDPNFDWGANGGSAPACSPSNNPKANEGAPSCSISNKPKEAAPAAPPADVKKPAASGNTACPMPADSPPPPPPPDVESIFHLCQKSIWEKAVQSKQPYFPPTYMNDGKFTRATVFKKDLVSTANEYYEDVEGDWIVVELDCKLLYSLGIPILAQDAPESTRKQPVKCLQGLVKSIYMMHRAPSGRFIRVVDPLPSAPKEEEKKEEAPQKEAARGLRLFSRLKK